MFTATRREWSELYTFFSLLAKGSLACGDAQGKATEQILPIAYIARQEHDGPRRYTLEGGEVHIEGEEIDCRVARKAFANIAQLVFDQLQLQREEEVESAPGVEEFLDELKIMNLEAQTEDRTDLHIAFYSVAAPAIGYRLHSRMCRMDLLLDGGRAANMKFEQTGAKFASPEVSKFNYYESHYEGEVADRMIAIERRGGVLKFSDAADKVFRSNLQLIDLNLPRLLGEMVRTMHLEGVTKIKELTDLMEQKNPFKIKDELISKHGYYRHKIKQLLLTAAFGMRPAKIYTGKDSAIAGFIFTDGKGEQIAFQKPNTDEFAEYLFLHTRLEKGSIDKDKYGLLYRENGQYYLNLNLKIGFLKR